MPITAGIQENLWSNYQLVVGGGFRSADHTQGVAALPSLHVAFHWLFALQARPLGRGLTALFALMTLLTFVGSLRTGWHYAVDGYAGVALATLAWWAARRLERDAASPG